MAQITLNSSGVASNGSLVLQSNGTTTAATFDTSQKLTLPNDAVVNGLTVGRGAGAVSTNTAVGASALAANTTGTRSVAVGSSALAAQTIGEQNVAVGYQTLTNSTSGNGLVSMGFQALASNTTGSANTALGFSALQANTTATQNTAVGYQAGYSNTTGANLVALGYQAGYSSNANNNTFIGYYAGQGTTGTLNTFVGVNGVGYLVSSGTRNTIIGAYNGNQGGLDIRTASNYIVLSDGDGRPNIVSVYSGSIYTTHFGDTPSSWGVNGVIVPTYNGANQPAFRTYDTNSSSNTYTTWSLYRNASQVGSVTTTLSATAYNTSSDYRLKENVQPMTGALSKVAQLKPCTYTWKVDGAAGQGFIAHELAEVVPDCVTGEKDAIDEDGNPVYQGIDTSFLVATLTAAIQELNAKFEAYKATHP